MIVYVKRSGDETCHCGKPATLDWNGIAYQFSVDGCGKCNYGSWARIKKNGDYQIPVEVNCPDKIRSALIERIKGDEKAFHRALVAVIEDGL
jgi:hypothetical protein